MKISLDDLALRRPVETDAEAVLALQIRCDIDEYGEPDSDMEDLQYEWRQIDLSQDAWVAFLPGGELLGYAAVLAGGKGIDYKFYVDPTWAGDELSKQLLALCEARGTELIAAVEAAENRSAKVYLLDTNRRGITVVEQAGFRPVKYIFQMRKDVTADLSEPVWPEGVRVRTADLEQDAHTIHQVVQTAFHLPGRDSQSFADWHNFMVRPDIFHSDLWFLAISAGELVSVSLCFSYPSLGWVRQLGVLPEWQKKGLGAALLRHSFQEFKRRGFTQVGLAVESERPNSFAFYQRVGMRVAAQLVQYIKPFAAKS